MNIDKYNYDSIAYAKNKCGIYKITNTITNKIYIGQSIDIYKRWKDEMSQAFSDIDNRDYNLVLAKTFRKYASDRQDVMSKFKFEILEECQPDELDIKEIYWIAKYNSCSKKGYNVTLGGKKDYCRTSSSEWLENLDNIEKDLKDDKLQKYSLQE
jgi:group I intron endonuclease